MKSAQAAQTDHRPPRISLALFPDQESVGARAAEHVQTLLAQRPEAVLALPTGRTPLPLYAQLRSRVAQGRLILERARIFNLDEYVGLSPDHPMSYAHYLRTELIEPCRVPAAQVRLLHGDLGDAQAERAECAASEAALEAAGGIDLAVLGLGANGHIAFNEPGADWHSRTHVVELSEATRAANAPTDGTAAQVPARGITLGIANLSAARQVLLLVSGAAKRPALEALLAGKPDPRWPVTSLIGHPGLIVLSDQSLSVT